MTQSRGAGRSLTTRGSLTRIRVQDKLEPEGPDRFPGPWALLFHLMGRSRSTGSMLPFHVRHEQVSEAKRELRSHFIIDPNGIIQSLEDVAAPCVCSRAVRLLIISSVPAGGSGRCPG